MFWLGMNQNRSGPANFDAIADYIESAGPPDVIAVSEVKGNTLLRSRELDQIVQRVGGQWDHQLFPQLAGRDQCTGLVWNKDRVRLLDAREVMVERSPKEWTKYCFANGLLTDQGNPVLLHDRRVFAGFFEAIGEGRTDFVVVPLHLKSSRGGVTHNRLRRYHEARTLLDALAPMTVEKGEMDVVLIGDTNMLAGVREEFELSEAGRTSGTRYIVTWGEPDFFRQLGGDAFNTHLDGVPGNDVPAVDRAPFDRAFVPAGQKEFSASEFRMHDSAVIADEPGYKRDVSDHVMIYFDVAVMGDDDPD